MHVFRVSEKLTSIRALDLHGFSSSTFEDKESAKLIFEYIKNMHSVRIPIGLVLTLVNSRISSLREVFIEINDSIPFEDLKTLKCFDLPQITHIHLFRSDSIRSNPASSSEILSVLVNVFTGINHLTLSIGDIWSNDSSEDVLQNDIEELMNWFRGHLQRNRQKPSDTDMFELEETIFGIDLDIGESFEPSGSLSQVSSRSAPLQSLTTVSLFLTFEKYTDHMWLFVDFLHEIGITVLLNANTWGLVSGPVFKYELLPGSELMKPHKRAEILTRTLSISEMIGINIPILVSLSIRAQELGLPMELFFGTSPIQPPRLSLTTTPPVYLTDFASAKVAGLVHELSILAPVISHLLISCVDTWSSELEQIYAIFLESIISGINVPIPSASLLGPPRVPFQTNYNSVMRSYSNSYSRSTSTSYTKSFQRQSQKYESKLQSISWISINKSTVDEELLIARVLAHSPCSNIRQFVLCFVSPSRETFAREILASLNSNNTPLLRKLILIGYGSVPETFLSVTFPLQLTHLVFVVDISSKLFVVGLCKVMESFAKNLPVESNLLFLNMVIKERKDHGAPWVQSLEYRLRSIFNQRKLQHIRISLEPVKDLPLMYCMRTTSMRCVDLSLMNGFIL
ncbi:hypothetical protein HK096_002429 [Nowakowskiella sp. JEL0078]|nr:hypothetical protein HK096_002429 [Nowakowskiella sp. JEL0078]